MNKPVWAYYQLINREKSMQAMKQATEVFSIRSGQLNKRNTFRPHSYLFQMVSMCQICGFDCQWHADVYIYIAVTFSVELFIYIKVCFCVLFEDPKKSFFDVPAFAFALFHLSGSIDVYRRPPPPTHTPPATHTHTLTHLHTLLEPFCIGTGPNWVCTRDINVTWWVIHWKREQGTQELCYSGLECLFYALILVNSSSNCSEKKSWQLQTKYMWDSETCKKTYSVKFIFNFSKLLKCFGCNIWNHYIPACYCQVLLLLSFCFQKKHDFLYF